MTSDQIRLPRERFYARAMIGIGLVAMGFLFFFLLSRNEPASAPDFVAVPAEVDFPAPELNLITLDESPVSLADYHGSVVLVNLWATWCPPCREEMPTLQKFYETYGNDGFLLVGINQEEQRSVVLPFVKEFNLTFPIWLDEDYLAQRAFNTVSLPSSYVIDRAGRVRLMWIGGISKQNLEKYVTPLIVKQ